MISIMVPIGEMEMAESQKRYSSKWQLENPEGTKYQCVKDTGLSKIQLKMVEQLIKTRYILLNTSLYKPCTRYLFKEDSWFL